MKLYLTTILVIVLSVKIYSQGCCSGGSGSPIAGGASQGVLQDKQMEISANYQYLESNRFLVGDRDTAHLFKDLYSDYLYTRLAYGVTKNLTISVESGYFLNKTQIGLSKSEVITSSGFGDLIIFPRYDILNKTTESKRTEITLGMGYKIPIGKYNDSTVVYTNPASGQKYYTTSPPTIQPTTGSQDFIFYGFALRENCTKKFKLFANALYIKKGWNPLGQKFGDYSSIGLFVSKTFFEKLGVTLQLKGEHISKMKYDKNVDMLALYNIDVKSTGSRKLFFVPQLSFSHKEFTVYALSEIPLYQFVNGTQVASQNQATVGVSYRFLTVKPKE